uniref:Uncharacterized protein n=1 Tax=Heterorhabditis bacteriophora TaxID=37862 RepID=A0A1I7XU22_HETBA
MRRTAAHNHEGVHFQKTGSEEAHTIETFERKIHGTPYSEPQRRFSSQQYTERRTYGRDENGDVVMKIEKNPSDPVRPVTPVRSVTPVGGHRDSHLLKPIQPLTIPRIDINNFSPNHSPKIRYQEDVSPRSVSYQLGSPSRSANVSPRSTSSSGSIGIPLKKVITINYLFTL